MKKLVRLKSMLLLACLVWTSFSCDKDEEELTERMTATTIVSVAQETDILSSLVSALSTADENEDSDLIGTLSSEGPFTVFAPTNDAFAALLNDLEGFDSLEDFDSDETRELLATILQYHVIAGTAAKAADLEDGQTLVTVQGEELTVRLDDGVFIDDATDIDAAVLMADVEAGNGIVHVIDKVLLPQAIIDALNGEEEEEETGTLVDVVVAAEQLSVLEAAVIKAGLAETLSSEGPFTVFAPTDDAFIALLDILGEDFNGLEDFDTEEELALLRNILLYHVIPAKVLAEDLAESTVATALQDNNIDIIASGDTFVIGDASDINANINATDIMASNGVAHTIDKVLLPQEALDFLATTNLKTIVEIAVATDDVSLLVEALQQANAGLVDTLNSEGPFTVFAPNNAAFVNLLNDLGDNFNSLSDFDTAEEKELLVKVLTYHVIAGKAAFSTDLSNGQQIKTVQGEKIGINIKNNTIHIEDATDDNAAVIGADIEASNGVIHIIDKVLLPQEVIDALTPALPSIVELAQSVDDLSLLVDALIQADAGLVDVLNGDGPFTVFAPTNRAFADLLHALGDDFNSLADFDTTEEKALLAKVLTYHVVAGKAAFSTDLSNGQQIGTVQGEKVGINIKNGRIHIEDATDTNATVTGADNEASNGVVHIIDKVLLPQEVLDILNPPVPTIVELAQATNDLSVLVSALVQADAGLVDVLNGEGPFTVFAPTNAAFAELLNDLGDDFNSLSDFDTAEEKALLATVLTYHVIAGEAIPSSEITGHTRLKTVQGERLEAIEKTPIRIKDKTDEKAEVLIADNEASNGIVHIIDKVLLPQEVLDILNPPTH